MSNFTWVLQVSAEARPERAGVHLKICSGADPVADEAHEPREALAPDVWPVMVPPAPGTNVKALPASGGGGAPASAGGGGGAPAGGVTRSAKAPCHPPTDPS